MSHLLPPNSSLLTQCENCFGISLHDLNEVPDFATLAQIIYIRIQESDAELCRRQQALYHLTQALKHFDPNFNKELLQKKPNYST